MNCVLFGLHLGFLTRSLCATAVGSPDMMYVIGRQSRSSPLRLESVMVCRIRNRNHKREEPRRRHLAVTACSLELPLLPFSASEVLLTVHRLRLDMAVGSHRKCKVENLEVGALVSIGAICRVRILNFQQAEPYLRGLVMPQMDTVPASPRVISSEVRKLDESLRNLNAVEFKLKSPKESTWQTNTADSLRGLECVERFIQSLAERVSFAGFQLVTGSTQSESFKLQQEKLRAVEWKETMRRRLDRVLELVKDNISLVAAKLAIQSLEIQQPQISF